MLGPACYFCLENVKFFTDSDLRVTLSRADIQGNCNIITTVPFFDGPTILPLASLASSSPGPFTRLSAADVLILELAAVCCFCVSGLIHFRHRVIQFTANEVTWYKFPPLSFLLLGSSCLGRPSGDVPCASEDMACGS